MLRLNLLRDLPAENSGSPKPPPYSGLLRRLATALLVLLLAGALLVFLTQPTWLHLPGSPWSKLYDYFPAKRKQAAAALEATRQDSLRRVETFSAAASRTVQTNQTLAAAWLEQLESVLPITEAQNAPNARNVQKARSPHIFSLAAFTPPGTFLLRGTAATEEALSTLQETLVLFPGMELLESQSGEAQPASAATEPGIPFLFSGTVQLDENDTVPVSNRVVTLAELQFELNALSRSALSAGISLTTPQEGAVSPSGPLRLHPFRVSGSCDSAGFSAIAVWLAAERARNSAFGIQRIALSQRGPQNLIFLDILAFTR
jgi:hypothetical protein